MTKLEIYNYLKQNPKEIFYHLAKDNFKLAKAFWGKINPIVIERVNKLYYENIPEIHDDFEDLTLSSWQYHLQIMALEEKPLKYLEKFLDK